MSAWYRHLGVLSRAIHFQNLTAASQHVGLSQPQLSRLVSQLEQGLGVSLLDRTVRRKTSWTALAHRLAQEFDRSEQRLDRSIQELLSDSISRELKGACLEGLASMAVQHLGRMSRGRHWREFHLDVLDQTELEERFLSGGVDIIWSSRVPGKRKPRHQLLLGYQTLDERDSGAAIDVFSSYEFARERKIKSERLRLVSNSLRVRELWFLNIGGKARFPSAVSQSSNKGRKPVLLVGGELVPEQTWSELVKVTSL